MSSDAPSRLAEVSTADRVDTMVALSDLLRFNGLLPWHDPGGAPEEPPAQMGLHPWLPDVVNQWNRPLCTAAVVTVFAGYLQRRAHGREHAASLLFNYRTSRGFSGNPNRRGSSLRHALWAWKIYGLPPEHSWPYSDDAVDVDPPNECFEEALRWRECHHYRLDGAEVSAEFYVEVLRTALALGLPASIDFPLHPSIVRSFVSGVIPVPEPDETVVARHVVLLCGYDDELPVENATAPGAFRFQNNWGVSWGDNGYGWLPYEFARRGLVRDSWVVPGVPIPTASAAYQYQDETTVNGGTCCGD